MYRYRYPHPAVAADICLFSMREGRLNLLLVLRRHDPFRGQWALPGGFLEPDEDLDACARRELWEETGIAAPALRQFGVFSDPGRDPRERVVSVAYIGMLPAAGAVPDAGSDAAAARWFAVEALPALAFDHARIVARALEALRHGPHSHASMEPRDEP